MSRAKLDKTGKTVFDDIYQSPDPRAYCREMQHLDYVVPAQAKDFFVSLFRSYLQQHPHKCETGLKVLDLGCSYGINAALLRLNISLDDFYRRFQSRDGLSPDQLISEDRQAYQQLQPATDLQMVGLDISQPALSYGETTGLMQNSVCVNLETDHLSEEQAGQLGQVDCIISTGCIGYITTTTLEKVLRACHSNKPWMAHCILRMFSLGEYLELFKDYGYFIDIGTEPVRQRRFASVVEQQEVRKRLDKMGIDSTGYEDQGWLYANLIKCTSGSA